MPDRDTIVRHVDEALGDDPRIALIAARKLLRDDVPWLELRAVRHARVYGYNWARIGRLLQRSRQALRSRYRAHAPMAFSLVDQDDELRRIRSDAAADRYRREVLAEFDRSGEAVPW
jgi:hypothetical protein